MCKGELQVAEISPEQYDSGSAREGSGVKPESRVLCTVGYASFRLGRFLEPELGTVLFFGVYLVFNILIFKNELKMN